jgi:ribonuclease D
VTSAAALSPSYINTPEGLSRLSQRCAQASRIAVDTEADSLHHYREKVCLVQISMEDDHYILDPLAVRDLTPLLEVLAERPLIFHGGDYDLRMLFLGYGFRAQEPVFDTMLAAQILGHEKLGLAALVLEFFDVELPKYGQKSDWSQRPLSQDLLDYAINDTRYLETLQDRLSAQLEELDRLQWHRETCARMVETALHPNHERDPEREWRIKGASALQGRALALVRALWYWREEQASLIDRPAFKVLNNSALLELAQWADDHPDEDLSQGPRLPRNFVGQRFASLKNTLAQACRLSHAQWPSRRPPRSLSPLDPDSVRPDEALVQALQAERDEVAKGLNLPPSVLAPRSVLLMLASRLPRTAEDILASTRLMRWQADLLSERFLGVLKKVNKPNGRQTNGSQPVSSATQDLLF